MIYILVDVINTKKETHTQTEVLKERQCGYMKSKKNLAFHLKQVLKLYIISTLFKEFVTIVC